MVAPSWNSFQKANASKEEENSVKQELTQEVPGELEDQKKPEPEQPQWGNFQTPMTYQGEPDPNADEGLFSTFVRGATRIASRGAEQLAGVYGNTEQFLKDTLTNMPKTGGILGWAVSELVGPENWKRIVQGNGQMLPTSKDFKKASQELTQGYTKPKTKGETELDEYAEDVFGTMPFSGGLAQTNFQRAANHLLIPAAANVSKKIVKDLGFGEDKANLAKVATWLPLLLANNVNGPAYASQLTNQGRQGYPQNLVTANTLRYENSLTRAERRMLHNDPGSELARQQIAGIRQDVANGQTSIQDLMTRYDAINRAKRSRGLFDLNRVDRNAAIRNINDVLGVVRNEIQTIGGANPRALQDWQNGIRAWGVIHQSRALTNWVESIAKGPYAKLAAAPAAALFGLGGVGAYHHPVVGITGTALAAAGYKTGQIMHRVIFDPRLRDYYFRAIGGAMEENLPVFINNYNKLNKELEKVQPKKKSAKKPEHAQ